MMRSRQKTVVLLAVTGLLIGALVGGLLGFALGYPEVPGADPKKQEGPGRPVAAVVGMVLGGAAGCLAVIIRMSRREEPKTPPPSRKRGRKGG
jgi:hypothetical protein